MNRREFLLGIGAAVSGCLMRPINVHPGGPPPFRISLAEWSLHRAIRSGALDHLDFPLTAKRDYGIDGVEYVSTLFKSHDEAYIRELKNRADHHGVRSLLIMCDGEGRL